MVNNQSWLMILRNRLVVQDHWSMVYTLRFHISFYKNFKTSCVSIILVKLELNVPFESVTRYINKSFGRSVVVYYGTYVSTLWTTSNITSNIYHVCAIYFRHNFYNIQYAFWIATDTENQITSENLIWNSHDLRTNLEQKTNLEEHICSFALKLTFRISLASRFRRYGNKSSNIV